MREKQLSPEVEDEIRLEHRAHRIRAAMLSDEKFMGGVVEGYAQAQRGETVTQAELDEEIEKVHPGFDSA
jgi:methyl coenzyme M reductase subunit C